LSAKVKKLRKRNHFVAQRRHLERIAIKATQEVDFQGARGAKRRLMTGACDGAVQLFLAPVAVCASTRVERTRGEGSDEEKAIAAANFGHFSIRMEYQTPLSLRFLYWVRTRVVFKQKVNLRFCRKMTRLWNLFLSSRSPLKWASKYDNRSWSTHTNGCSEAAHYFRCQLGKRHFLGGFSAHVRTHKAITFYVSRNVFCRLLQ